MSTGVNDALRASVKERLAVLVYCPSCEADTLFPVIPWYCGDCWPDCLLCKNSKALPVRNAAGLEEPAPHLLCGQCYNEHRTPGAPEWIREGKSGSRSHLVGYDSEVEARLLWALDGYRRHPGLHSPFPGDVPAMVVYAGPSGSSIFAKVKAAVSVEEVAGRYTVLQRVGPGKLKGCCPLHQERTPSFYVYTDTQTWRCFGACAIGGDVIKLTQELMNRGIIAA